MRKVSKGGKVRCTFGGFPGEKSVDIGVKKGLKKRCKKVKKGVDKVLSAWYSIKVASDRVG